MTLLTLAVFASVMPLRWQSPDSTASSPQILMLDEAVITAAAQSVTVREDTVIYNAAAYRLAPDASLEDLVRKIPGVEISPSGSITLHGRPVTQLLVNGKRFFGTSVRSGLKNLSADMVDNVKAYERESDEARLSGIEDGESEPVLDVSIRKSFLDRWRGNVAGGGGNEGRYSARANASRIGGDSQYSVTASSSDCPSQMGGNITSRNQVGGGSRGDATDTQAGFSFAVQKRNGASVDGGFNYEDKDSDVSFTGRSETVNASSTTYACSSGANLARTPSAHAWANIELHPTGKSSLLIKPSVKYDGTRRTGGNSSQSFSMADMTGPVNASDNVSGNYTGRLQGSVSVQYSHRSAVKKRRSWSVRANVTANRYSSDQFNSYRTRYYRIKSNPDSVLLRKYYSDLDNHTVNLGLQGSWNEPLGGKFSLVGSYRVEWRSVHQDKSCYNLTGVGDGWQIASGVGLGSQIAGLPAGWSDCLDGRISYNCSYSLLVQTATLSLKYNRKKVYFVGGVSLRPQTSVFRYPLDGVLESERVNNFNAAPELVLRYTFKKTSKLSLKYKTRVSTPGLTSLMPVVNGTNPLSIRTGNPSLKAPFIHDANLSYNFSNLRKQNSLVCNLTYSMTENAVSSSCTYDPESGARTYMPRNIDGNWRVAASSAFTKTFHGGGFSMTNHAAGEYRNDASYLYNSSLKTDEVNNTGRLMLREMLEGSLRTGPFELVIGGGVNYTDERSSLRPQMRQQPLTYVASASGSVSFPWKGRLETDFTSLFQRGYSYDELNKNYHVWNLEVSQQLFRGGILRLSWYDMLGSQENLTRTFSASRRAVNIYNGVTSYLLLSFSYTFREKR